MSRFLKVLGAVAVINIIARLLGFSREVIIGYQYGTSFQADSIIAAFTIPNFIYIVIGGAITTAFISVYSKLDIAHRDGFVQVIFTGLSLMVGFITILFVVFPNMWINLFFSGMSKESLDLTTSLFRLMAPATLFLVLSMLFSGLLNMHEEYRLSSFSTLLFNGFFLVIGVAFTPLMFEYSYGLGALLGSCMMLIFIFFYVRKRKLVKFRMKLEWNGPVKRFIMLAMPIIFGGATIQFYFIIQRIYASGLEEGAISALNYASKMTQFPQAVLMTSVTTVIYPLLAKAVGEKNEKKFISAYKKGFQMLSIILLPATFFVFFYAKEIIQFIFEYGSFGTEATNATYPLLRLLSLTMFSLALNTYITRFFYAKENSYLPIVLNIVSVFGVNILIISLFIDGGGALAIASGTVIATIVNTIMLIIAAKIKLDLKLSNFKYIMKLFGYLVISAITLYCGSRLEFEYAITSLLIGACVTLLAIIAGMKLVK
ncbi:murein biosynthesis integral membrane protein MurJ [Oceanobacillus massiliensis]|uniref:murein biosynthesis integral membrane protein MurJ n=1 Tax=Oceanobacillus massiliensis TaxID=1465765 RepID=UPI0030160843